MASVLFVLNKSDLIAIIQGRQSWFMTWCGLWQGFNRWKQLKKCVTYKSWQDSRLSGESLKAAPCTVHTHKHIWDMWGSVGDQCSLMKWVCEKTCLTHTRFPQRHNRTNSVHLRRSVSVLTSCLEAWNFPSYDPLFLLSPTLNSQLTNDDKPALLFRSGCEYTLYHPTDARKMCPRSKCRKNVVLSMKEKSFFALCLNTAKLPFKERKSDCFWGFKTRAFGFTFPLLLFSISLSRGKHTQLFDKHY